MRTPTEVKILLLKKGLTFKGMAEQLKGDVGDASVRSLEVMIADLLYSRRWYPTLAAELKSRFGITVERPPHLRPIREQLRQAA